MSSQPEYRRGEVIYADLPLMTASGSKRRPAVIISSDEYNQVRGQVIACGTTSRIRVIPFGDYLLADWQSAGLSLPSAVTAWPTTIRKEKILRRYGQVSARDLAAIDRSLILILGLEARMGLNPDLLGLDS